jgi:hypothetical protein
MLNIEVPKRLIVLAVHQSQGILNRWAFDLLDQGRDEVHVKALDGGIIARGDWTPQLCAARVIHRRVLSQAPKALTGEDRKTCSAQRFEVRIGFANLGHEHLYPALPGGASQAVEELEAGVIIKRIGWADVRDAGLLAIVTEEQLPDC